MDLQKLIYLEAIYRAGGFTKAAEELHVSQPAITNAIKHLEEDLSVQLIRREPKGISFTEAGRALVVWARRIMEDFESARREMSQYSEADNMTLNLGISNMVGSWLYGEVYSPFMRKYPGSTIILKEYPWGELCQLVIDKKLDMAYTTWEKGFSDPRLDLDHYMDSELYLVLPPKHELADYKRVPFKALENRYLSVFAKSSLIHKIVTERCAQEGVNTHPISVTNHFSTMLNMVDDGTALGFVVMDQKSLPFNKRKYVLRPLDEPVLLETGFVSRHAAKPSKIMKLFASYTRQHLP